MEEEAKPHKYNGPEIISGNNKQKSKKAYKVYAMPQTADRVQLPEAATIKTMFCSGMSISQVAKTVKRSPGTVKSVVESFDKYLPDDPSLREKIHKQMEQITDGLMSQARAIVEKADGIVYDRLDSPEVGPAEASRVSRDYMDRFARITGEEKLVSQKGQEKSYNEEKVNNILQNVFNININMSEKNDRSRETPPNTETDPGATQAGDERDSKESS